MITHKIGIELTAFEAHILLALMEQALAEATPESPMIGLYSKFASQCQGSMVQPSIPSPPVDTSHIASGQSYVAGEDILAGQIVTRDGDIVRKSVPSDIDGENEPETTTGDPDAGESTKASVTVEIGECGVADSANEIRKGNSSPEAVEKANKEKPCEQCKFYLDSAADEKSPCNNCDDTASNWQSQMEEMACSNCKNRKKINSKPCIECVSYSKYERDPEVTR